GRGWGPPRGPPWRGCARRTQAAPLKGRGEGASPPPNYNPSNASSQLQTRAHRHIHFRVSSVACAADVAISSAATPARSSLFHDTVTASRRFPLGDESVCSAPNIFVRPNLQRCSLWIALDERC